MELVAFLGMDKENWGQVAALMKRAQWDRIIIVKKKDTDDFPAPENSVTMEFDTDKPLVELKEQMMEKLRPKLSGDLEVSLSLASGNGKEHMALLSALLNIPVGIRIVVFTKKGVEYIT